MAEEQRSADDENKCLHLSLNLIGEHATIHDNNSMDVLYHIGEHATIHDNNSMDVLYHIGEHVTIQNNNLMDVLYLIGEHATIHVIIPHLKIVSRDWLT